MTGVCICIFPHGCSSALTDTRQFFRCVSDQEREPFSRRNGCLGYISQQQNTMESAQLQVTEVNASVFFSSPSLSCGCESQLVRIGTRQGAWARSQGESRAHNHVVVAGPPDLLYRRFTVTMSKEV